MLMYVVTFCTLFPAIFLLIFLFDFKKVTVKKPLLSLAAAYGSGSDTESDTSDSEGEKSIEGKLQNNEVEVYR